MAAKHEKGWDTARVATRTEFYSSKQSEKQKCQLEDRVQLSRRL